MTNYDFSNFSFRCHYFSELATKSRGRTNLEKYEDLVEKVLIAQEKLAAMKPALATYQKLANKILDMIEEKTALREIKDEIILSDTAKKRLSQIWTEVTTGRTKDIKSKYIEKGLLLEEDAITAYSLHTSEFFEKNTVRVDNGFVNGEIDFKSEDCLFDTKVSWDIFSFDSHAWKKIPNANLWQMRCYLWLWGVEKGIVVYTLLDTPAHLIETEKRNFKRDFAGTEEDLVAAYSDIEFKMTYQDLPLDRKIRFYDVERDEDLEVYMKNLVISCRKYLNNFDKQTENEDYEIDSQERSD